MNKVYPVILSGGAGTRLWPMSTPARPKQFLPLTGDVSMFQLSLQRVQRPDLFHDPIIIGAAGHADLMTTQLAEAGSRASAIILEPCARNTAAAIGLAAAQARALGGDNAMVMVMTSDHAIANVPALQAAIAQAIPAVADGWIVTFGITPSRPDTGYGYIKLGAPFADDADIHAVARFVEKPDGPTAQAMLAEGGYAWNAGMFMFAAGRFLDALASHAPDIAAGVRAAHDGAVHAGPRVMPDADAFAATRSDSIDYAVIEKDDRVACIPIDIGWSDVGSWDVLRDLAARDDAGNAAAGSVQLVDSRGCLVRTDGRIHIAGLGLDDMIIVASGDTVMIMPAGRSQDVKKFDQSGTP